MDAALRYARHGWSVIPCGRDKRPSVSWIRWQSQRADEAQIREWWGRWPEANVGVVTGAVSGIVVLDLDRGHAEGVDGLQSIRDAGLFLPATPSVRTPKGGVHAYFRHPGREVPNAAAIVPGVDVRGDGGYVVAPPSETDAGRYEAIAETRGAPMAEVPDWVSRRRIAASTTVAPDEWGSLWAEPCASGQRNATAAKLAGHLAAHGIGEPEAVALLSLWALSRCDQHPEPFEEPEAEGVVRSVYRTDARRHPERAETAARRGEFWWRSGAGEAGR